MSHRCRPGLLLLEILVIVVSAIYGLFVGAIPGLTATMAAALLIPFTFFMDPVPALVSEKHTPSPCPAPAHVSALLMVRSR